MPGKGRSIWCFVPGQHFFRKDKKVYLTSEGIDKLSTIKLTGTKIPLFFDLEHRCDFDSEDPEYLDDFETIPGNFKTPWRLWQEIFRFPCRKRKNPKRLENLRFIEDVIRKYLEKEMGKTWNFYPPGTYDVFNADLLGGVPDGEELDLLGENVISILEIKVTSRTHAEKFSKIPEDYWLQLALYLYLRNLDQGYLCICYLNSENWEDLSTFSLTKPLVKYLENETVFEGTLVPYISGLSSCNWKIELKEAYCKDYGDQENELVLYKLKIDMEKYQAILDQICNWFKEHKNQSPDLLDNELAHFLERNKLR